MWKGWISFILGGGLIVVAFISGLQIPFIVLLLGTAIAFIWVFELKGWEDLANSLIGLWLFICGFIPGFITTQHLFHNFNLLKHMWPYQHDQQRIKI